MLAAIPVAIFLTLFAASPDGSDIRGLRYSCQFVGAIAAYVFTATAKSDAREELEIRNIDN